ncbi:GrpB family protein [Schaalia sp. 19OD2882]|nr:GrpB family protein [Schaalia sp. 19OD2882]
MTLEELWQLFPIELVPPRPDWDERYVQEAFALTSVLPEGVVLHHIGSTAIPGIWSKPIVDILAEVRSGAFDEAEEALLASGWLLMNREARRLHFNKGYTPAGFAPRVFHLHVVTPGDTPELTFRDRMRAHPEEAKAYEALKLSLWKRFEHNRDGYTDAKTDFIQSALVAEEIRDASPGKD